MEVVFIVGSIFKEMGRMLFQVEGATEQRPGGRKILLNTHGPDCLELREHIRKSWTELTSFFVCLFCFQFGTVDQGMRIEMPLTSHLRSFGQAFWGMVSDPYQKVTYCLFFFSLSNFVCICFKKISEDCLHSVVLYSFQKYQHDFI